MATDSRTAEVEKHEVIYFIEKKKETRHMFKYGISYF